MNKNKVAGSLQFWQGKLLERFAVLSGDEQLRGEALARQQAGKVTHAIGEGQDLIKRALRHRQQHLGL